MNQGNFQTQEQGLQQGLYQKLSPQQVMLARLLELPVEDLRQRVENELIANPYMEKKQEGQDEDCQSDESSSEADTVSETSCMDDPEDDVSDDVPQNMNDSMAARTNMEDGDPRSFYDKLNDQIAEYDITPHQKELLEYLIGSLEDDGLLKRPLNAIADDIEIKLGIMTDERELEDVLHILWQFDPPGIGARSLQECLLLQIDRDTDNPWAPKMKQVVSKCYDDFERNRWDRISERLKLTEAQTNRLRKEIKRLNPKPGSSLSESTSAAPNQVTPDFIVETDGYGGVSMTLNDGYIPSLEISRDVLDELEDFDKEKDKKHSKMEMEGIKYKRDYVDKGQMFIKAIAQRRESMSLTMRAIISMQKPFFQEGDESLLQPMKLEDIAKKTGYDISTISRICNSKYVQTTFGTYPLKWFFSHVATHNEAGHSVSVREVKTVLKEIVDNESADDRLSDDRLSQIMKEKGYDIARRTIAKYREQMGIPVARMR